MTHDGHLLKGILDNKKVVRKELAAFMNMDQSNLNQLYKKEKLPEDKLIQVRIFMLSNYNYDIRQFFPHLSHDLPFGAMPKDQQVMQLEQKLSDLNEKYTECLEQQVETITHRLHFLDRYTATMEETNRLLKAITLKL
jgi:hypothetical protein